MRRSEQGELQRGLTPAEHGLDGCTLHGEIGRHRDLYSLCSDHLRPDSGVFEVLLDLADLLVALLELEGQCIELFIVGLFRALDATRLRLAFLSFLCEWQEAARGSRMLISSSRGVP